MPNGIALAPKVSERVAAREWSLGSVIRGKPGTLCLVIVCLPARGHLLIEDVPGAGKTTLAHTLAGSLDSQFQRTEFTSGMLPSDVQVLAFAERLGYVTPHHVKHLANRVLVHRISLLARHGGGGALEGAVQVWKRFRGR